MTRIVSNAAAASIAEPRACVRVEASLTPSAKQLIGELGMPLGSSPMISSEREELDRALIDAKLLEAEHAPPSTDAPRCCVVKVNVQGGVDVQVQVNVNAI